MTDNTNAEHRTAQIIPSNRRRPVLGLALALIAALTFQVRAHADTVVVAGSNAIVGQGSYEYAIDSSDAGTLTLNLTDFAWPTASFADLSLEVLSGTQILDTLNGPGQLTLQLPGAGTYYALVSGTAAQSNLGINVGAYGLTGVLASPVPLPQSVVLLLTGLAGVAWLLRRKAPADKKTFILAA